METRPGAQGSKYDEQGFGVICGDELPVFSLDRPQNAAKLGEWAGNLGVFHDQQAEGDTWHPLVTRRQVSGFSMVFTFGFSGCHQD